MKLIDIENATLSWSAEDAATYGNDFGGGVLYALDKLTDEAPTIEVPRWIPVTERLPTEEDGSRYGDVWAVQKNSHADTWHWEYVRKHPQRFTHWMPLPGDPEKE